MSTVTIPKKIYNELVGKSLPYDLLSEVIKGNVFNQPPTKNRSEIIRAFRETKKYSPAFLRSLGIGLRRSSFFK